MNKEMTHTRAADQKSLFGFWVYIMTDCVVFASLFAAYVVLENRTASGPDSSEIFNLPYVLIETLLLLTSSFTAGLALLAAHQKQRDMVVRWLLITFALGLVFLGMEIYEFNALIGEGHSWTRSAFLSGYFTLVGTHGLHITAGLLWLIFLLFQVARSGIVGSSAKRLMLFGMFWHFLDVVWIFIFTIVYLRGVI